LAAAGHTTPRITSSTRYSNAIAIDAGGNATIASKTGSSNFPVTQAAYQQSSYEIASGGYHTGFVTKLNSTGTAPIYSTYLGGSDGSEGISGLALDKAGNTYVTGGTYATTFPVSKGAYQATNKAGDNLGEVPFVTDLNPSGAALVYSTYFGGSTSDSANALALGPSNMVYITGWTQSTDFPDSAGAFQTSNKTSSPDFTAFVAKLSLPASSVPDATTTTVTCSPNPQTVGQSMICTATVAGVGTQILPNGSVKFTVAGWPAGLAAPATPVATTTATLNAIVNTFGPAGMYHFQYGASPTASTATTAQSVVAASTAQLMVSTPLAALKAKTTYYYRPVVTTAGGTSYGAILSFTTK
jgi:hypothetical protein